MKKVHDVLRDKREELGYTLSQVSKKTKISKENLVKVEQGAWGMFSSYAYAQGMVTKYAAFLGLEHENILALLRRDAASNDVVFIRKTNYTQYKDNSGTIFSKNTLIGIFLVCTMLFFLVQFVVFWRKPLLHLDTVPQSVKVSQPVVIKGRVEAGTLLYLNDERLFQRSDGTFSQELYLRKGTRKMTLKALGQNGKVETKEIVIEVQ